MKITINETFEVPVRWLNAAKWLKEEINWKWIMETVEEGLLHIEEYNGLPFDISPEEFRNKYGKQIRRQYATYKGIEKQIEKRS